MKEVDPHAILKRFVEAHPNQRTAASALNITEQHLSHLLNKRRKLNPRLCEFLGIKHVMVKQ